VGLFSQLLAQWRIRSLGCASRSNSPDCSDSEDDPGGQIEFELDAEHDFGHLPFGNFVQRLLQTKIVYAFSPNLIISGFTQYDTESRQVGANNRIRWTIRPEADLFIVWNRGWRHRGGSAAARRSRRGEAAADSGIVVAETRAVVRGSARSSGATSAFRQQRRSVPLLPDKAALREQERRYHVHGAAQ